MKHIRGPWYLCAQWAVRVAARIVLRIRVQGLENIPHGAPVIIASNHISLWDPPLIGAFVPRLLHFFAKEELFSVPLVGRIIHSLNAFPVKREENDMSALRKAIEVLKMNHGLVLFPEGTRQKSGEMGTPRAGLGLIAAKTKAAVVPVRVLREDSGRYRLLFGPPLSMSDSDRAARNYAGFSEEVMRQIAELPQKMVK